MHFGFCLLILIPLTSALVPVQNKEDAVIHLFEHQYEELKALVEDLESKLESTEETNIEYADRLTSAEKIIRELSDSNEDHRRAFTESQVAFYAKLSGSLHGLSPHQTIKFDELVTNTSASLYDTATGIFTAPVSGMYVISWTANVNYKQAQATELMVNDVAKASSYADTARGGDGDYGSASQTVVLQVNKGEEVLVRTGTNGNGDVHGADYSTFSAFLLFPHS
ncbi:complement C1q-like protein 4 [Mytilus californianus]|uniref:complement C1q-like protein 4 n=1 Tax=Mytilus californianus TaxID=6549 RepID=UPI00224503D6|nr:complement C1q-like protein 4 [Mytilus californianus]